MYFRNWFSLDRMSASRAGSSWVAVLLAIVTLISVTALPASAELPPPTLAGRMLANNGGAELTITLPAVLQSSTVRQGLAIIITREVGGKPTAIAMFSKPNVTTVFIDHAAASGGSYRYQAAAMSTAGSSGWSPVLTVSGTGTPTQPTPTPTPTPVPSQPSPKPSPTPTPKPPTSPTPTPTPVPAVGLNCHDLPLPKGVADCLPGFEEEVVRLTNVERAKTGAKALTANRQLNCAARKNLSYLAQNNIFAHTGWDQYIHASGYPGTAMGQNLAQGYPHPTSVMFAWMNSTGHRTALLNPASKEIGVSCLVGPGYSVWWMQDFGSQ